MNAVFIHSHRTLVSNGSRTNVQRPIARIDRVDTSKHPKRAFGRDLIEYGIN